ncbi:MAG TPA: hypothetical protein DCP73_13275 [Chloroflexi bacterium]|nr:hypothetical protein [Chloroflexota bacterium]
MHTYDPSASLTLCTGTCTECGSVRIGTQMSSAPGGAGDFVCAQCDTISFEIASDAQKEAWLSGAKPTYNKVG